jgi:hypothetical protein
MIAKDHKLRIVAVADKKVVVGVVGYVRAWVIYRILPYGESARVGKSSDPVRLLRLVKKLAGITEKPAQPA